MKELDEAKKRTRAIGFAFWLVMLANSGIELRVLLNWESYSAESQSMAVFWLTCFVFTTVSGATLLILMRWIERNSKGRSESR